MREVLLVFIGGGIGSVLRWLTGLAALRIAGPNFPWGTLAVNVIGCFVMGLLFRLLPVPDEGGEAPRLLILTGVLGGFTTFSAFSLDAAGLWMKGDAGAAILYAAASVLVSLTAVAIGLVLGKWVAG